MDDDDADYMQGSEDEVNQRCSIYRTLRLTLISRTTVSIIPITKTRMNQAARMSRICITKRNVCPHPSICTLIFI